MDFIIETIVEITARLDDVQHGLSLNPRPIVEISLDCPECIRRCRTVAITDSTQNTNLILGMVSSYTKLKTIDYTSVCLPSGHSFPAAIESYVIETLRNTISLHLNLRYQFADFSASAGTLKGDSRRMPRWIRMHFSYKCPNCGINRNNSVQTNLVRPYTTFCKCGQKQYTEKAPPVMVLQSEPK